MQRLPRYAAYLTTVSTYTWQLSDAVHRVAATMHSEILCRKAALLYYCSGNCRLLCSAACTTQRHVAVPACQLPSTLDAAQRIRSSQGTCCCNCSLSSAALHRFLSVMCRRCCEDALPLQHCSTITLQMATEFLTAMIAASSWCPWFADCDIRSSIDLLRDVTYLRYNNIATTTCCNTSQ